MSRDNYYGNEATDRLKYDGLYAKVDFDLHAELQTIWKNARLEEILAKIIIADLECQKSISLCLNEFERSQLLTMGFVLTNAYPNLYNISWLQSPKAVSAMQEYHEKLGLPSSSFQPFYSRALDLLKNSAYKNYFNVDVELYGIGNRNKSLIAAQLKCFFRKCNLETRVHLRDTDNDNIVLCNIAWKL